MPDLLVDLGLGDEVYLVLDEDHGDVSALVLHLLPPLPHRRQGVAVSRGEGHHAGLGAAVVRSTIRSIYLSIQSSHSITMKYLTFVRVICSIITFTA